MIVTANMSTAGPSRFIDSFEKAYDLKGISGN
jgi:hypothetical protein